MFYPRGLGLCRRRRELLAGEMYFVPASLVYAEARRIIWRNDPGVFYLAYVTVLLLWCRMGYRVAH